MKKLLNLFLLLCSFTVYGQYVDIDKPASSYTLGEIQSLESKPGAPTLIYIATGSYFPNISDIEMGKRRILQAWLHTSEKYRGFDVNVTTSKAAYDAVPTQNKMIFRPNTALGGGGQCALTNWGSGEGLPCSGAVEHYVVVHEIGHGMGLRHSVGTQQNTTNNGVSFAQWTMGGGDSYYDIWTVGDFEAGTGVKDDIGILSAKTGYRADDHGGSNATATDIVFNGGEDTVRPQNNNGIIEQDGDVDMFRFSTNGGSIDLFINPLKYYNNLHVKSELYDATGNLVLSGAPVFHYLEPHAGTNNGTSRRVAQGTHLEGILTAGTYYIRITNTGFSDASGSGYTSYSSLGYYDISGYVHTTDPVASFIPSTNMICAGSNTSVTFENNSRGGLTNTYAWEFEGGDISTSTAKEPVVVFNTIGKHKVTLTVTNALGNSKLVKMIHVGDQAHEVVVSSDKFHAEVLANRHNAVYIRPTDDFGVEVRVNFLGTELYHKTAKDFSPKGATEMSLDMCVLDTCYDLYIDEPFKPETTSGVAPCGINYYTNSISLGDQVVYKGVIYELVGSNLDNTNKAILPDASSASWDSIGLCISVDTTSYFTFTNTTTNNLYFKETHRSLDLTGGANFSKSFCNGHDIAPEAIFDAPTYACINSQHTFGNSSKGSNNTYAWTFEGANITTSTLKNPTVTFNTPGKHKVSLRATNGGGTSLSNKWVFIGDVPIEFLVTKVGFNDEFQPQWGSVRKGLLFTISSGGNQLFTTSASSFTTKTSDTNYVMEDMCLTDDCYQIEVEDAFTPETCGYGIFNDSRIYNTGDFTYYQGKVYQAKYWTQRVAPPAAAWQFISDCTSNSTSVYYKVVDPATSQEYLKVTQKSYDSTNVITGSPIKIDNFCIGTDQCPNDPNKVVPGICGCGVADADSDADGVPDCLDQCPNDFYKTSPGDCGCGKAEDVSCKSIDHCPGDPLKMSPGTCGCGVVDVDTDTDGTADCIDLCPNDVNKVTAGLCGCGNIEMNPCVTSVVKTIEGMTFEYYPNPFDNNFTMMLNGLDAMNYKINITDVSGALVHSGFYSVGSKIEVGEDFAQGLYFIHVSNEKASLNRVFKIVKK